MLNKGSVKRILIIISLLVVMSSSFGRLLSTVNAFSFLPSISRRHASHRVFLAAFNQHQQQQQHQEHQRSSMIRLFADLTSNDPLDDNSKVKVVEGAVDTSKKQPGRRRRRQLLLADRLQELRIDPAGLHEAALSSLQRPTEGYDGRYGKSAIKTYRAFLYPKKQKQNDDDDNDIHLLTAAAGRCARQIEFLLQRHQSHQAEFVRHHDTTNTTSSSASRRSFPLVVLLDNVRSALNVGSVFRTADAAGVSMVVTTGITPHPNGGGAEKLHKSALGAEQMVPSRHFATTRDALEFVRNELGEYELIGVETTERSVPYTNHVYAPKGAVLVLGNEVTGVSVEIMSDLDAIVEIPMFGIKNSLNIAACAPVILYEVLRQWKQV